jgi:type IV pilus assembly protein PilV
MHVKAAGAPAVGMRANTMRGFSLIEMLIAVVVLSVGLLGMAGLQGYSLRNNNSAYHRTQANLLAYDILDAMRANREKALKNAYGAPGDDARAIADLADWRLNLSEILPAGTGTVDCSATPICTVVVQWNDTRGLSEGATQQLSLSTQL